MEFVVRRYVDEVDPRLLNFPNNTQIIFDSQIQKAQIELGDVVKDNQLAFQLETISFQP
jgi:hypothetical protein